MEEEESWEVRAEKRRLAREERAKELARVEAELAERRAARSQPPAAHSPANPLPKAASPRHSPVVRSTPPRRSVLDSLLSFPPHGAGPLVRASTSSALVEEFLWDTEDESADSAQVSPESNRPAGLDTVGRVLAHVPEPERARLQHRVRDGADAAQIRAHLVNEGRLSLESVHHLLSAVREIVVREANVVEVTQLPASIFGDIHGQFFDLLPLVADLDEQLHTAAGPLGSLVFLGDYVDRGCFSTEVCLYLFALKIAHPASVVLLRGNHESRLMSTTHNFELECTRKYDRRTYELFMDVFDALPLAALVRRGGPGKDLFCVHGGLSPDLQTLDDILALNRFGEIPDAGALCDLMWSDPLTDQYPDLTDREKSRIGYLFNSGRQCGKIFGEKALVDFLDRNGLAAVVRAHEVQPEGYVELYGRRCLTLFSAPNYCDFYGNRAAVLTADEADWSWATYAWSPHPAYLPEFANGLAYSLPMIAEQVADFFLAVLKMADEETDAPAQKPTSAASAEAQTQRELQRRRLRRMMERMRHYRERNDALLRRIRAQPMPSFRDALDTDRANEARPAIKLAPHLLQRSLTL